MTPFPSDPTPTTEAESAYLAIPPHEDDSPRHVDDYEASWFIRGFDEAAAQARAEAIRDIEAYAEGERAGIEIGRTEALDVEVLARAVASVEGHARPSESWLQRVAAEYRAVLAGETE